MKNINEAMGDNFSFDELNSIQGFSGRLKYCQKHLGPNFGKGSSRVIFELDDNTVLKLAFNEKGKAQNENESGISDHVSIFTHVYKEAPDYEWIVSENVIPAKQSDFKAVLGITWKKFIDIVYAFYNQYCNPRYKFSTSITSDEYTYFVEDCDNAWWFSELNDYMCNWQIPVGDMTRISTYGLAKRDNGVQIVILDGGLTQDTYDRFYKPKKQNNLFENRESKNINLARKYCMSKGYSQGSAQGTIDDIRHDIPNSRLCDCKFLLGVTRMLLNNEIEDEHIIMKLNKTLKYVASPAHVNEYDNNLNNLHCSDLITRFEQVSTDDLENDKKRSNELSFTGQTQYNIVQIPNFDAASQYADYTSWCVTQEPGNYSAYTNNGEGIFYFCLKEGFESVPEEKGENCPLDEYGLSMIAVSVNMDGSCNTITCRWNHDNGGNDNIMSVEQLENIVQKPFYQTFKPKSYEEILKEREWAADECLAFINDEYGRESTKYYLNDLDVKIEGNEMYVFHGLKFGDESYSFMDDNYGVTGDIILSYDKETDNYILDYPYSLPKNVFDLIPSPAMECGYYLILSERAGYSSLNYFLYDTNKHNYVIQPKNGNTYRTYYHAGELISVVGDKNTNKMEFYHQNGEKFFETIGDGRLYDVTGYEISQDRLLAIHYFIVPIVLSYGTGKNGFNVFTIDNQNNITQMFNGETVEFDYKKGTFWFKSSQGYFLYYETLYKKCDYNPVDEIVQMTLGFTVFMKDGKKYAWTPSNNRIVPYEISGYMNEEISIKPFEAKENLHPKFWINNKLNSKVRMRLLDIADDFVKTLDIRWVKPEDIVLTGSIANYNWTKYSDIDIHIIMDFKKVYSKTDFVKNYFDSKKNEWNSTHEKLRIYGFNVELSVEDVDAPCVSTGVYSLEKNDWVTEPKDLSDAKLNKNYVEKTAEEYITKIDKLNKEISKESDAKKIETLSGKMLSIFNRLKGLRRDGLKTKAKEMSSGNIIWKILRAEGYIKKIWDVINFNYDRQMSLNEGSWGVLPLQSDDGLDFKAQLTRKVLEINKKELDGTKSTREAYSALGNVLLLLKKIKGWYSKDDLIESGLDKSIKDKIEYLNKNIEDFLYPWNNDVKDDAKTVVENLPKVYDKILDQYALDGDNYECTEKDDDLEGDGLLATCYKSMAKDKKEKLNEDYIDDIITNVYEDIDAYTVLMDFVDAPKGSKEKWNLIKPAQYNRALQDFMQNGEAMRFPDNIVDEWIKLIITNSIKIDINNELAGHSQWFPFDDFRNVFEGQYEEWCAKRGFDPNEDEYGNASDFLEEIGWYNYAVLPDGSDGFSDYGLQPIIKILHEYEPNMSTGEKLILVNRCLDVWHCRGDLSSAFIEGGAKVLTQISAGDYVNECKPKTIIIHESQLEGAAPGYENVYLNSWLGKFKEVLKRNNITTPMLHDAMKRMGIQQVKPGVYTKKSLYYAMNNIGTLKRILGIKDEIPFTNNFNAQPKSTEYEKPDYTPPLSNMDNASNDCLSKDM